MRYLKRNNTNDKMNMDTKNKDTIRLQKFFTDCGVLSRRRAEDEIKAGSVTVNGVRAELGTKIDPARDIVLWNGKAVQPDSGDPRRTYIMLNKPIGYVTTLSDEKGRLTVADLLSSVGTRVYPIGRLDMYSDGLLLCTSDGNLANRLMHPSHDVAKKYIVTLKGCLTNDDILRLTVPMELDGYRLRPIEARLLTTGETLNDGVVASTVEVILHEGRNRQIRRMCEIAGLKVLRLRRVAVGQLQLGTLPPGKWRHLTDDEVAYLKSI